MEKKTLQIREITPLKKYAVILDEKEYSFTEKEILIEKKFSKKTNLPVFNYHLQFKKVDDLYDLTNICNLIIGKTDIDKNPVEIYFDENHNYIKKIETQLDKEKRINTDKKIVVSEYLDEKEIKEYEKAQKIISNLEEQARKRYQEKLMNAPENMNKSQLIDVNEKYREALRKAGIDPDSI